MIKQPLPLSAKSFFAHEYFVSKANKNVLLIFTTEEEAQESYKQLLFFKHQNKVTNIATHYSNILYFPSFDTIPYDRISPNQNILSARANILSYLAINTQRKLLVTNAVNLLSKLPPLEYLAKSCLKLHC